MQLLIPAARVALITTLALGATSAVPVARPFLTLASSASLNADPIRPATTFIAPTTQGLATQAPTTTSPTPIPVATITRGRAFVLPEQAGQGRAGEQPGGKGSTGQDNGVAIFAWPLFPRPAVARRFDRPRDAWSAGHRGVDLLATAGQPVLSSGDGIVSFSGVIAGRGVITVLHAGGLRTTYEPVDERITTGTLVQRGSTIGVLSSRPGHCGALHCLHWGAIFGQTYRDPLSLLGLGRPVLLPLG